MKTLNLQNLTSDERDGAIRLALADVAQLPNVHWIDHVLAYGGEYPDVRSVPDYPTSLDATTPLLIGRHWIAWTQSESLTAPVRYFFGVYPKKSDKGNGYAPSFADTEPLSRCYALLRDAGWEVIT